MDVLLNGTKILKVTIKCIWCYENVNKNVDVTHEADELWCDCKSFM